MNPPGNPGIRGCRLPILIRNGVLPGRIKIEVSGKNSGRVKSKQERNISIGCGNPAVAGDSRFRGNDGHLAHLVIPAKAGIQLIRSNLLRSYNEVCYLVDTSSYFPYSSSQTGIVNHST